MDQTPSRQEAATKPRKPTRRQIERCAQVLDAAEACFVELGFHGASMAMIAKRADMSIGHIYHYFANKDAIVEAVVSRDFEPQRQTVESLRTLTADALRAKLLARAVEAVRTRADPFRSVLNLEIHAECQRNARVAKIVRQQEDALRAAFVEMLSDTLGLPDAEGRVEILFALFAGLPIRAMRNPEQNEAELAQVVGQTLDRWLSP